MKLLLSIVLSFSIAGMAAAQTPRRVAVLEIAPKAGFDRDRAELFNEFLQNELRAAGFTVIGKGDIEAMLGLEKLKDALACNSTSCFAEIGGALGVDEVVTGAVGMLNPYLLITLKRLSPKEGRVLNQVAEKIMEGDDRQLVDSIPRIVAQLYQLATPTRPATEAPKLAAPSELKPPSAPVPTVGSGDELVIGRLSQGVQITVADENEAYDVVVKTASETFSCKTTVNFLNPCVLPVPPGPAVVEVAGQGEQKVVFEPGRSVYRLQFGSYTPLFAGASMLAGGLGLLTFGLTRDCQPTVDSFGNETSSSSCAGKLVPIIVGGISAYGGLILAIVGGILSGSVAPVLEPYEQAQATAE